MLKGILLGTLMLCLVNLAHAGDAGKGPCAKDREALCGSVEAGEGRILKCMADNKDKLSAECKEHHEKMKEHRADMKEACQEDVQKHCADVKGGHGRIMKCMHKNEEKLSEGCKAEIKSMKENRKKMRKGA